jgi:ArsR family transcriptional regulator
MVVAPDDTFGAHPVGVLYITSMTVDLKVVDLDLAPKKKRPAGEPCCDPVVHPEVDEAEAGRIAAVGRALSDPIRVQLVDVLRRHAGKVCVCELTPLFDVSQPTVSHHLKVLREAGLVDVERRGLWSFYYVIPDAMKELKTWLR